MSPQRWEALEGLLLPTKLPSGNRLHETATRARVIIVVFAPALKQGVEEQSGGDQEQWGRAHSIRQRPGSSQPCRAQLSHRRHTTFQHCNEVCAACHP